MARPALMIALGATLTCVALAPRMARACSCLPVKPPAEALTEAAAVFEGRSFSSAEVDGRIRHTFEVTRYWKGEVGMQVNIDTAPNSAMCGRSFTEGSTYLVYAREVDGTLRDNMCSRTRTSDKAKEDFEVLGNAMTPGEPDATPAPAEPPRIDSPAPTAEPQPPAPTPSKRGCTIDSRRAASPWLLASALLLVSRRRRRAPPR